jgi:hypothetical protein
MLHSVYRGLTIYCRVGPGHRLKWTGGGFAADTLAGIRRLIKESLP